MSIQVRQNYRPKIHFTPLSMWTNDPNGMVYVDGTYHLFYQHYPEAPVWGPMHWGHAISKDLLTWEHLPIALYPDELGLVFSGSCVYDVHNTSGLGSEGKAPMVAIYTSHDRNTHVEHQSIAYSTDYIHFEKGYGNPVVHNPGLKDFRDPKAFWNNALNCWSLVLAANDRVNFYCSKDLKKWDKTGEFLIGNNGLNGICECPDCFPVMTEDGIKWILIISMILEGENTKNHHKTQYFIGDFDGNTFIDTEQAEEPLWLNYGPDHYAGVTFQNLDKPVMIGWASNWAYADKVPTLGYRGQMAMPCEVTLKKTPLGYRAAFQPAGLDQPKNDCVPVGNEVTLSSQSFGLGITGAGQGKITLSNSSGEKLVVEVTEDEIIVNRTKVDKTNISELFGLPEFSDIRVKRYQKGNYELELYFDVSVLEVFGEDGLIPITMSVYPESPFDRMTFEGEMNAAMFML